MVTRSPAGSEKEIELLGLRLRFTLLRAVSAGISSIRQLPPAPDGLVASGWRDSFPKDPVQVGIFLVEKSHD